MSWDLRSPRSSTARPRVLSVDDEPVILRLISRLLELHGFEVVTCSDPALVVSTFEEGQFDVVITDIRMPRMGGLELLNTLRDKQPDLPVVVVTGEGTVDTAIQALREGATGMLVKPFTGDELLTEVRRALSAAQIQYEALQYRYLSPVLDSIALTLSSALEARNLETAEHCRQLGLWSERMATVLGVEDREVMSIRIGGYLHDIGKIGIADAILLKPGPLDEDEMAEMRRHADIGAAILEVHEAMSEIAQIVRHHHERWDGQGYPDRIMGPDIPLGGRIIAVADAFHAMTNDRVYRAAMPVDQAWAELRAHSGHQFDPAIVEVFEQVVDAQGRVVPLATGPVGDSGVKDAGPIPVLGLQARLAGLPTTAGRHASPTRSAKECPAGVESTIPGDSADTGDESQEGDSPATRAGSSYQVA